MVGLVLLLSGLVLLGAAVSWWLRCSPPETGLVRPVSTPVSRDSDLIPESGKGDGENALAAFYAYQIAVGKINRH
jgi:hypothetical protein